MSEAEGELLKRLVAMVHPGDESIVKEVANPRWEIDANWMHQIPDELREIWGNLSLETKLVACIVAIEGIVPSNDE